MSALGSDRNAAHQLSASRSIAYYLANLTNQHRTRLYNHSWIKLH
ncbi:hypothetical protein [Nostoc piscinale]|nr:hypothetical protein [Nostoc piscinale]